MSQKKIIYVVHNETPVLNAILNIISTKLSKTGNLQFRNSPLPHKFPKAIVVQCNTKLYSKIDTENYFDHICNK